MQTRTIMIFPKFQNIDVIDKIRHRYDPLAELVRPHITLVFPFEDEMDNVKLNDYISSRINGFKPFTLTMSGVGRYSDNNGGFIFLKVVQGREQVVQLHDRLYDGSLKQYLKDIPYNPHITLGTFDNSENMDIAWEAVRDINEEFTCTVRGLSVEIIGENGESVIILEKEW